MSIFTVADLAAFKSNRLLRVAQRLFPDAQLSDTYLMSALQASETDMERRLRTLFEVRQVLPMNVTPATASPPVPAGMATLADPGYPFDPMLFEGDTWSLVAPRFTPIVSVQSMTFNYPSPSDVLYTVPPDWIRFDGRKGHIQLIPTTNLVQFPFTALLLTVATGGREIPYFLQIQYQAGMPNIRTEGLDIIDAIMKDAVLRVIDDEFLPSSLSLSADGLSQSFSADCDKYRTLLEKRVATLRQSLRGISMGVL